MDQAKEVQKEIEDGKLTGPLAGVPVAVKDNICTRGIATPPAPPGSSRISSPLRRICGAKAEGGRNWYSWERPIWMSLPWDAPRKPAPYGVTRNPWNPAACAGRIVRRLQRQWRQGSVLAPLEATRAAPSASPAGFCGVAGMKPTYGTVSRNGTDRLWLVPGSDRPPVQRTWRTAPPCWRRSAATTGWIPPAWSGRRIFLRPCTGM